MRELRLLHDHGSGVALTLAALSVRRNGRAGEVHRFYVAGAPLIGLLLVESRSLGICEVFKNAHVYQI